jgi:hypothetical protein
MSAFDPNRTSAHMAGCLGLTQPILKTRLAFSERNKAFALSLGPRSSMPAMHSPGGQNGWFEPNRTLCVLLPRSSRQGPLDICQLYRRACR